MWHMTYDMWNVTHDMWHTGDGEHFIKRGIMFCGNIKLKEALNKQILSASVPEAARKINIRKKLNFFVILYVTF